MTDYPPSYFWNTDITLDDNTLGSEADNHPYAQPVPSSHQYLPGFLERSTTSHEILPTPTPASHHALHPTGAIPPENLDVFSSMPLHEAYSSPSNTEVWNFQYVGPFGGSSMVRNQGGVQNTHAPFFQPQAVSYCNAFDTGLGCIAAFQHPLPYTNHAPSVSSTHSSYWHGIILSDPSPDSGVRLGQSANDLRISDLSLQDGSEGRLSYAAVRHAFAETILSSPSLGPLIVQKMYRPRGGKDFERFALGAMLLPPLYFQKGSERGICLYDIVYNRTGDLVGASDTVFEGAGQSASIRVSWPGYSKWSKQICTKNYRKDPTYISRKKAAERIANALQAFFTAVREEKVTKKRNGTTQQDQSDTGPNPNHIRWQDVVLVSLHNVSQGSWQPQLRIRPRAQPSVHVLHSATQTANSTMNGGNHYNPRRYTEISIDRAV